jgi:hypothetical protein
VGIEDEGIVEVLVGAGKLVRCGDPDMDMGFLCINLWVFCVLIRDRYHLSLPKLMKVHGRVGRSEFHAQP